MSSAIGDVSRAIAQVVGTIASGFLVPLLKKGAIYSVIGLFVSLALASLISTVFLEGREHSEVAKLAEIAIVFGSFGVVGTLAGLGHAASSVTVRRLDTLESELHRVLEPVVARMVAELPAVNREVEIQALRAHLSQAADELVASV